MPRSYADQYTPLLEAAMEEEIGIYLETDNKNGLLNTLYEARTKSGNPVFDDLVILQPLIEGHPNVLFLAKKTTELVE